MYSFIGKGQIMFLKINIDAIIEIDGIHCGHMCKYLNIVRGCCTLLGTQGEKLHADIKEEKYFRCTECLVRENMVKIKNRKK